MLRVYLCRKVDATNLCLTFPMLEAEIGMHFIVYFTTLSVPGYTACHVKMVNKSD